MLPVGSRAGIVHLNKIDTALGDGLRGACVWHPQDDAVVDTLGQHQVAQPAHAVHIVPVHLHSSTYYVTKGSGMHIAMIWTTIASKARDQYSTVHQHSRYALMCLRAVIC